MYNIMLCVVITTVLNLVCVGTGFFLGYIRNYCEENEITEPKKMLFRNNLKEVLEEAYVPEND